MNLPIDKNRHWVASLHECIGTLEEAQKAAILKGPGLDCASDLLSLCEAHLGKQIDTVQDLVNGWNMLRDSRGLKGRWKMENGRAHGIFSECGCPLVRSGLIQLHPIQCLCSQGMMDAIFSKVARKAVRVKIKRAIGRGDKVCEFAVHL